MKNWKVILLLVLACAAVIGSLMVGFNYTMEKTSTNDYCISCHVHTDADVSWKQSVHHNNGSGTVTDCAACHLPPKGTLAHTTTKMRLGISHMWAYLVKDREKINWAKMGELAHAKGIVFNSSCEECHQNLFPDGIADEGITAHLYYEDNKEKLDLQCISCHLDAGHYDPNYKHEQMVGKVEVSGGQIYGTAAAVDRFADFVETVPGTSASIEMVAVPGGTFMMGSPDSEPCRNGDEGPVREVTLSPFFMGRYEVTWDQFWSFYNETMSEGRTPPSAIYANNSRPDLDAVSGPTPPFGSPDQGWGKGSLPAITMTHYSAETFCQWLSLKTGKKYRLPTEAEWEYAARGGTDTPYFFEGDPAKLSGKGLFGKLFPAKTDTLDSYVVYAGDSDGRTSLPSEMKANPFGLKNMLGNVMEYCSDWYAADAYAGGAVRDPKGPESGTEHVVRGGNFESSPSEVRCAARSHTEHDNWLVTDPQNPKSIWWYSDIVGIGFRVVCEVPEGIQM